MTELQTILDTTHFGEEIVVKDLFVGFSDEAVGFYMDDANLCYVIDPTDRKVYTLDAGEKDFGKELSVEPFEMYFPTETN
jgi:hypothetical protein